MKTFYIISHSENNGFDFKKTAYKNAPLVSANLRVFVSEQTPAVDPTADEMSALFSSPALVVLKLSKLGIRRKLRAMGKEDAFNTALAALPHAQADWDDAQEIRTDDALFVENAAALKTAVGLTDDEFASILTP
jgi:hypothetical protein